MKKNTQAEDRIYGVLKQDGPMTPTEVTKKTGYARETVWRSLRNLLATDQIREVSRADSIESKKGMAGATYEVVDVDYGYSALTAVVQVWMRT